MTAVTVLVVNSDDIASHHLANLDDRGYQTIHINTNKWHIQENPSHLPDIALISFLSEEFDIAIGGKSVYKRLNDIPAIYIIQPGLIKGFEQFAKSGDDFVVDPFVTEELIIRMQIALSRTNEKKIDDFAKITVGENLEINFMQQIVVKDGQTIKLSPKEVELLRILIQNNGKVVPQETLIQQVWPDSRGDQGKLRVHISRLRQKLELDAHYPRYLQTAYGHGYRFILIHPDKKRFLTYG